MTHRGPLVTLVGLAVAFVVAFLVNQVAAPRAAPASSVSPSASPARPTTAASRTPSASAFPDQVVFAGRTKDHSAAVAVAVRGTAVAAYVCDGHTIESWLRGQIAGDTVVLKSKNGQNTLTGRLQGKRLVGTFDLRGRRLAFTLQVAKPPAGIYRARGAKTTIGWIVLPNGRQVGIATTGTKSVPAPELDPARPEVAVDGVSLTGEPVAGDLDI